MTGLPGLSDEQCRHLLISVGTHRRDRALSPLEVAELLEKALGAGATRRQIRSVLQLGSTQVSTFLRLLELDPGIRHLAGWSGKAKSTIPFSSLAHLAGLSRSDQTAAAEAILQHGLSWKEVVQLVQMKQRSVDSLGTCVEAVLRLRPTVVSRHVFVGAVTDPAVMSALAGLTQGQRDAFLARVIAALVDPSMDVNSRLGVEKFSVVSDADISRAVGLNADALETRINEELARLCPDAGTH